MHHEVDGIGIRDADLNQPSRLIRTDEHGEVVEGEHSDRVPVSVQDVVVEDPVLSSTPENYRIHNVNLP